MDSERYTETRMPWDSVLRQAWEHEIAGRPYAAAEAYARGARMLGAVDEKRAQCNFKRAFELLESAGPVQFQSMHPVKLHPYGHVEEVLAEGPLRIYPARGMMRPVCVGNYVLLVDAMSPNIDVSGGTGRLRFPAEQIFLTLPDDEVAKALALLRPGKGYVYAHEASQTITSATQRVATALESGGHAVGNMILSGAENLVSRRRAKWIQQQQQHDLRNNNSAMPARSSVPRPILIAANFTVSAVQMASQALTTVQGWFKSAGSRIASAISTLAGGEEAHPSVRAAGELVSSVVVGILSVFGGLWRGVGQILSGIGTAIVITARARFGDRTGNVIDKTVSTAAQAAKAVGTASNLPGAMIEGAFPTTDKRPAVPLAQVVTQTVPQVQQRQMSSSSSQQQHQAHHGHGTHKAKLHGERKSSKDSSSMRQRQPDISADHDTRGIQ
jgi:hypothetical protein